MQFKKIVHKEVKEDGTFKNEKGAVHTKGKVMFGVDDCPLDNPPVYWLSVILPRTSEGVVEGIKVEFETREEMRRMLGF